MINLPFIVDNPFGPTQFSTINWAIKSAKSLADGNDDDYIPSVISFNNRFTFISIYKKTYARDHSINPDWQKINNRLYMRKSYMTAE